ncbi:MAG: hypothetical protein MZV49_10825 [Rhodopseudomonas palustris]|nr:hypothetical protein [Rhodopseudomonas palustris]
MRLALTLPSNPCSGHFHAEQRLSLAAQASARQPPDEFQQIDQAKEEIAIVERERRRTSPIT